MVFRNIEITQLYSLYARLYLSLIRGVCGVSVVMERRRRSFYDSLALITYSSRFITWVPDELPTDSRDERCCCYYSCHISCISVLLELACLLDSSVVGWWGWAQIDRYNVSQGKWVMIEGGSCREWWNYVMFSNVAYGCYKNLSNRYLRTF